MSYWKKLSYLGVKPEKEDLTQSDIRYIVLTNRFAITAAIANLLLVVVSASVYLATGETRALMMFVVGIFATVMFLTSLYFNAKCRHFLAVNVAVYSGLLEIIAGTVFAGKEFGFHSFSVVGLFAPFLLFRRENLKSATIASIVFSITWLALATFANDEPIVGSRAEWLIQPLNILTLAVISTILITISYYSRKTLEVAEDTSYREAQKSEKLLLNILPEQIANILKEDDSTIARGHDNVTVLFADIANFTPLSESLSPEKLIELLNLIFTEFDHIARRNGIEKIKTIGDAYMAVAGAPEAHDEHAKIVALTALEMVDAAKQFIDPNGDPVFLRIGIHSGPATAGVIGAHKFAYDLWGDTVNTAARMESHGETGKIQVSDVTYELLKDLFKLEERGVIDVKGKGEMKTWWLIGTQ